MITTEMTADGLGGAALELPPLFRVQNGDQGPYDGTSIQVSSAK
jgi:hypothetical protein